ncbi:MAG: integrase [Rhodospirillaceae bacterium]|nr:integrase [Rhodospirillaceae bacterium]
MPSVTKEYGVYRVRIRCRGLPHVSKTFTSKTDARRWGEKTERAMQLGLLSPDQDCTLKELLLRYGRDITPTKRGAPQELSRIHKLCQHRITALRLADLQSSHIARFRDERLKEVSGTTVAKDLSLLSLVLNTARMEWGFKLPSNPVALVKKPKENKPRDRRLVEGEYDRLVQKCGKRNNHWFKPLVMVALETGMRRGELLSLEWKHVHLDKNWAHLPLTKNGEERDIPLSQKACEELQALPRDISGVVFPISIGALRGLWD